MKYLLLLLIALASCHTVKKDPLPVVKCLLESDKLANDIVAVIDAVKKFVEDKDLNALLSVCLTAVPDAYNEVMKCVNQDVNLQKFKFPKPPKVKPPKVKPPKVKPPKVKPPKVKPPKVKPPKVKPPKVKLPKVKLPKIDIGKIVKGTKFKELTKKLQGQFKKMLKKVPKKLLNGILNALKDYGVDQAKKLCNEHIDGGEAICDNLDMLKDEIKFQIQ